ncbi:pentapeptide repeat-containing protein [Pyxidicoccus sp. 3LFB2]
MIQFSDREITGERLELDSKTELYYLGHDLTLRNCTLVIRVPERALVISKTRLIDCTLEVKRELRGFRWHNAILKGCRFSGALSGCEFGRWPDEEAPELGNIEGCDFTGARLEACRFLQCDARTLKFPSWPCFTILDPVRRKSELLALPWPGTMRITVESFVEGPPETAAVTYFAPAVAKRTGTTEDAIRAVLAPLPRVLL